MSKLIIEPQKVAPIYLGTPEDQLEKRGMSPLWGEKVLIIIQLQIFLAHYISLQPPHCLIFQIVCLLVTLYCKNQVCRVKVSSIK